jgi:DNA-binding winged helix-turn-helix (wHTH) protein
MTIGFGPFTLDEGRRQLFSGSDAVHLSPKAFELLAFLIHRRPEAISKSDILNALWPDAFVSEGNLAVLINEIRAALDDSARQPRFIRTVQRFGYAFSGLITEPDGVQNPSRRSAACWLAWQGERVLLKRGENVLGRDPAADVRVDAVGVSRRHAMIVIDHDAALLHDLGSKNGTYANDVQVDSPVGLVDGAEIRLGPAVLRFHQLANVTSTQTLSIPDPRPSR